MKTLVVYSSLTGNTKKVAEAVAEVMPSCTLCAVEDAPASVEKYGLVGVGFWASKGQPDVKTREWLKGVTNTHLAFFGTLGAKPESEHAKECMEKVEELALMPERGNIVLGSWMCQGKIDPKIVEVMKKLNLDVHRDLLKDSSRIEEAARHPDEDDRRAARDFFHQILENMGTTTQIDVHGRR